MKSGNSIRNRSALGLIFLEYISDAFEEKHATLEKEKGADPEDRDYSLSASDGERVGVRCRSDVSEFSHKQQFLNMVERHTFGG